MHYLEAEDVSTMRKIAINVAVLVGVACALLVITVSVT